MSVVRWFYSHVSLITDIVRMLTLPRGTTTVPDNMMYTVFAPVGVRGVDLTQHPNELDKVNALTVSCKLNTISTILCAQVRLHPPFSE